MNVIFCFMNYSGGVDRPVTGMGGFKTGYGSTISFDNVVHD